MYMFFILLVVYIQSNRDLHQIVNTDKDLKAMQGLLVFICLCIFGERGKGVGAWGILVLTQSLDYRDYLMITFLIIHKNVCFDPLLVPSWQDDSNAGSQYMFYIYVLK